MRRFHELMTGYSTQRDAGPGLLTVEAVFDRFLERCSAEVERGERKRSTLRGYVWLLTHAANRFGELKVAELKPFHVNAWVDRPGHRMTFCKAAGRKILTPVVWGSTMRSNAVTAVKAALQWARDGGMITSNPIAGMVRPTRETRQAILTDEQVMQALDATRGTAFADLLLALWGTGCRPGEITSLTAAQIDFESGTWIVANKTEKKTGRKVRIVYLTPAIVELSRRLALKNPEGPIFLNQRGRPWTIQSQNHAWCRLRKRFGWGKEATSYAIRHRYAIESLRSGLDSSEVAALMGHSDTAMVDRVYGHWAEEQTQRLKAAALRVRGGPEPEQLAEPKRGRRRA
jgi:integrase